MHSKKFLKEVDARLRVYGQDRHGNAEDPIDELVFIILSGQTEEYAYLETYNCLRDSLPKWEYIHNTSVDEIAVLISKGGLQNKKARYIKSALARIRDDFGELTLSRLQEYSDEQALGYLESLPGVSAKTARCIMMYSLGREVFPVDTHVWRICRRLGLAPAVPKPTSTQQIALEELVPPAIRYSLHVNLVSHGREICTTYWPECEKCTLEDLCPSSGKPDEVWGKWRNPQGVWANYTNRKT